MATIITLNDPMGINEREKESTDTPLLLDYLINKYGLDGFDVPTRIYKGTVKAENEIKLSDHVHDGCPITKDDVIIVCRTPQGFDPITFIASFIVTQILVSLVPTPETPEIDIASNRQSPNNAISGQTNLVRALQRIPDIYGKNRVYPDLIAQSYFEYINHKKNITEFFCIGRGEYLVEDIKSAETNIDEIAGSSTDVYQPFTRPLLVLAVVSSEHVSNNVINAPNIPLLSIDSIDIEFTASNIFESTDAELLEFDALVAGDFFEIQNASSTLNITGFVLHWRKEDVQNRIYSPSIFLGDAVSGHSIITISGSDSGYNGTYRIYNYSNGLTVDLKNLDWSIPNFNTFYDSTASTITDIYDNNMVREFGSFTKIIDTINNPPDPTIYRVTCQDVGVFDIPSRDETTKIISSETKPDYLGYFNVYGKPEQIWFHFELPNGLISDSGGNATLDITIELQNIDSNGSDIDAVDSHSFTYTDSNNNARYYTEKLTPLSIGDNYKVKVIRVTSETTATDETRWIGLDSVKIITNNDFGDVTTILVSTESLKQATIARKLNAVVTRKLKTIENGVLTATTQATAKMADAMLHIITDPKMGNKPIAQVDTDALYAIQGALDIDAIYSDKLGRFCYTFSDSSSPVLEEIKACGNSARVFINRGGDNVYFGRDEKQPIRTTIFNQRNKKPDAESKVVAIHKINDKNGISLEWQNETTGETKTIVFPEGQTPSNPKTIQAVGIKNYEQAWNRAKYEYLKLLLQKVKVTTDITAEGLLLNSGDRVGNVDGTNYKSQGGEIVSVNGLAITVSDKIDFNGNANGSIILRNDDNSVSSPIVAVAGANEYELILASIPFDVKIRGDDDYQIGTLYLFSDNGDYAKNDYTVQSITPLDDGYVTIDMINYTDAIYIADEETPTQEA